MYAAAILDFEDGAGGRQLTFRVEGLTVGGFQLKFVQLECTINVTQQCYVQLVTLNN